MGLGFQTSKRMQMTENRRTESKKKWEKILNEERRGKETGKSGRQGCTVFGRGRKPKP
ncbi:hypothetical protein SESBI_13836 [Sesbania bispinosa]|nr:hypothetical protein SESBI_13836 [Sesbania bispinosa]